MNNAITNQERFNMEFFHSLDDLYMIIDTEEDKLWHQYALKGLLFASPVSLAMPQARYLLIDEVDDGGINLNNLAYLANNLEMRSPYELGINLQDYKKIISINQKMGEYYNSIALPLSEKLKIKYGLAQPKNIITLDGTRNRNLRN